MKRTEIKELYKSSESLSGQCVTVCGWVRTIRDSKALGFIELNDGSCFKGVQIVFEDAKLPNFKEIVKVNVGAALVVTGELLLTPEMKQPFEIHAQEIVIEGASTPDYPLQKKRHTLEYLRTVAHLRPRTNTFSAAFRVRSAAAFAIHKFFQENDFIYAHTPIITGSDCEGAGEMFHVTSFDLNDAEFWMVEPEIAFADLEDDMELAEAMMKYVIRYVLDVCAADIAFCNQFIDKGLLERLNHVANSDFGRVTYTEAIELLKKNNDNFEYKVEWGVDLQTEHEKYLTEQVFGRPVFVTDYPKEIKAFYMRLNDDGKTVAAVDLLVPGIGEIIGGSQREERLELLEKRMAELSLNREDYWWYLDLRRYGGTKHAGFGIGFERLIMYLTGISNIRDVLPFPRTTGTAEF